MVINLLRFGFCIQLISFSSYVSLALRLPHVLPLSLPLPLPHRLNMLLSSREMDHRHKCSDVSTTGFHFVNILLHASVVQLIFLLVRRESTLGLPYEFMLAAYFAVHPIHTEAVSTPAPTVSPSLLPCSRVSLPFPIVITIPASSPDERKREPHSPDFPS